MSSIVADNLKIANCANFITDIDTGKYYTFIGLPNASDYIDDWDSNVPDPVDNFDYLNYYKSNILGVKKITSSDVIRVIPKITWSTGIKYDLYRHDYSRYTFNKGKTSTTRLYDSRYYVMNKDYKVYICLYNGHTSENPKGIPSTSEPLHTESAPQQEDDGYIWKYLYTISPAEALKFDSTNYISVPNNWETSTDSDIVRIRNYAIQNEGKIDIVLIERSTPYAISNLVYNNVPILGDGSGAFATVYFDEFSSPYKVEVTSSGSGYTYASLDLDSVVSPLGEKSVFNVIIPPNGGHGKNIYTELGAYRALVYSRIENSITNPDFIEGNQFSIVGIIKNIKNFSTGSDFTDNTGSGVYALKLTTNASLETLDSKITQDSTNSTGILVSLITVNGETVVKYIQPREGYVDTYSDISQNILQTFDANTVTNYSGLSTASTYEFNEFEGGSIKIYSNPVSFTTYTIDSNFNGDSLNDVFFGQSFSSGISVPDINTKSADIMYIDNRSSISRQENQREDIKIILEF